MSDSFLYWTRFTLDFLIVSYIIYRILLFTHDKKAGNILKGMAVIAGIWVFSGILGLEGLRVIFGQVLIYGIFGLIVIFQPELRHALENLGKRNFSITGTQDSKNKNCLSTDTVEGVVKAMNYMSKRHIGALICFEEKDSLEQYAKTGIPIDSKISEQILENIFTPNVPLHDGALIIRNHRIDAASCYLPLSKTESISKHLGTRHRASLGLSEVTDATILIVSEETGAMSIARNGELHYNVDEQQLKNELNRLIQSLDSENQNVGFFELAKTFLFSKASTVPKENISNDEDKETPKERTKDNG